MASGRLRARPPCRPLAPYLRRPCPILTASAVRAGAPAAPDRPGAPPQPARGVTAILEPSRATEALPVRVVTRPPRSPASRTRPRAAVVRTAPAADATGR